MPFPSAGKVAFRPKEEMTDEGDFKTICRVRVSSLAKLISLFRLGKNKSAEAPLISHLR